VDLHFGRLGVFGFGKLGHAARHTGLEVGRDKAGRLMTMAGIIPLAHCPGQRTTIASLGNDAPTTLPSHFS
jgi:hypothetical protein